MSGTTRKKKPTTKRPSPWAIRGVSQEARNAAMSAATREGQTLGEWLDRAIREQIKTARANPPGPTLEETMVKLVETLDRQNSRLDAIEARTEALQDRRGLLAGNLFERLYGLLRGKNHPSREQRPQTEA